MENKKALVIIPPYSEPLTKLGQILSSPEESEFTDIYVLEDMKEAGQLIPTLGQCLIVIANAKKCALFLQENRWAVSKNHSKVILMVPKEMPQKTLMKFLKIGLTEAILETLPPKSLLYKIKLLLRSVKGLENKKEENINVKSMLDTNQTKTNDEQQRIEKGIISDEDNSVSEDNSDNEKKMVLEDDSDSFDYLKSKKKTTQEDNTIETHWKSKLATNQDNTEPTDENNIKNKEVEALSTYYKNERNQNLDLDFIHNENMKGKGSKAEDESTIDIEKLKNFFLDEIELEASSKKKSKASNVEDDEDIYAYKEKEKELALEKEDDHRKTEQEENSTDDDNKKKEKSFDELTAKKEKSEKNNSDDNHIDSYYKGKVKKNDNLIEAEEDYIEKMEVEEVELGKDKEIEKEVMLSDESKDYHEKKNKNDSEANEKDSNKNSLDAEESADAYMRGKINNSNKNLEEAEDLYQKNEVTQELEKENKKEDINKAHEEEDNFKDYSKKALVEEIKEANDFKDLKEKQEEVEGSLSTPKKGLHELDLDFDASSLNDSDENKDKNGNSSDNKLQRLTLDETEAFERSSKNEKLDEERNPTLKKLKTTDFELENGADNFNKGNGNVEQIDKYMRSKSSKKEDQNWDIANKKNDSQIELTKGKSSQVDIDLNQQFKDAGEQTIDYRKLKEEFELLKSGSSLPSEEIENLRKLVRGEVSDDDDSSARVFTPEPKGLDFLIDMAIDYYDPSIKPKALFEKIAKKLLAQNAFAVFLQYSKNSDPKESFSAFQLTDNGLIADDIRERFMELKKENNFYKSQAAYSMANWRCAEILDKNNQQWEDTELPTWAPNELHNKTVEYIYPMFDGLDRMGHIYLWFPKGITYSEAKFIDILLESSRPIFLDSIIRESKKEESKKEENEDSGTEKKNGIFDGIASLFGRKKSG